MTENADDTLKDIRFINYCISLELWKSDISMKKYINYFSEKTCLGLNQVEIYSKTVLCPKIFKLTHSAIDTLKNQQKFKSLIFADDFIDNNSLFTMLPEHIEYITLQGTSNMVFDQEEVLDLTNLPRELIYLDIGYKFKYLLTLDYLPTGLKVLRMGSKLDVPINNLPQGLEILEIGSAFNHSIDNLPDSIRILIFKTKSRDWYIYKSKPFNIYINKINKLPLGLEILILEDVLDSVICNIDFSYLDNLTYLALPHNFDDVKFFEPEIIKWSPNLKKLHIGKIYNQIINVLPSCLEVLIVHQNFNLEDNLVSVPSSLKNVMIDVRNEYIYNDKCNYETFKKLEDKFPGLKIKFLSK